MLDNNKDEKEGHQLFFSRTENKLYECPSLLIIKGQPAFHYANGK
jgi:hypothetical protein